MTPRVPGAALAPLRDVFRDDPNVVRAWWSDDAVVASLEDVGAPRVLRVVGRDGVSLRCGPADRLPPGARRGILVYERGDG